MLNAPIPCSNKRHWLVLDEPRIRTNAYVSEGGALIPAGDFERLSLSRRCAHFCFPTRQTDSVVSVASTEVLRGGWRGPSAKERFQSASTVSQRPGSTDINIINNSSSQIVSSTIIVVLPSENLDEYLPFVPSSFTWQ